MPAKKRSAAISFEREFTLDGKTIALDGTMLKNVVDWATRSNDEMSASLGFATPYITKHRGTDVPPPGKVFEALVALRRKFSEGACEDADACELFEAYDRALAEKTPATTVVAASAEPLEKTANFQSSNPVVGRIKINAPMLVALHAGEAETFGEQFIKCNPRNLLHQSAVWDEMTSLLKEAKAKGPESFDARKKLSTLHTKLGLELDDGFCLKNTQPAPDTALQAGR